jgi:hypothetical protein
MYVAALWRLLVVLAEMLHLDVLSPGRLLPLRPGRRDHQHCVEYYRSGVASLC